MKSELRIATIHRHWFREILSRFEKLETRVDKGLKSLSKKGKLAKEGSKKVVSPLEKVIVETLMRRPRMMSFFMVVVPTHIETDFIRVDQREEAIDQV